MVPSDLSPRTQSWTAVLKCNVLRCSVLTAIPRGFTASASIRNDAGRLRFAYCGIADRWKCTIFQSEPRLAITNVTRPGLLKGLPSNTPVELFNPAMTTAVSDRTMTSDELIGAARGFRVRSAPSKYFRIAAGSVTTV